MLRLWSVLPYLQRKLFRLFEDLRCSHIVIDDCEVSSFFNMIELQ